MVKLKSDYISCSCRWRSCIQSAKTRPGADCGSDNQLFIANFRLKPQKAGKTTRTVTSDLNQIPYKYAVEVMNRFKGLDLVCLNSVPELGTEVCNTVQEQKTKPSHGKRKARKQIFI